MIHISESVQKRNSKLDYNKIDLISFFQRQVKFCMKDINNNSRKYYHLQYLIICSGTSVQELHLVHNSGENCYCLVHAIGMAVVMFDYLMPFANKTKILPNNSICKPNCCTELLYLQKIRDAYSSYNYSKCMNIELTQN